MKLSSHMAHVFPRHTMSDLPTIPLAKAAICSTLLASSTLMVQAVRPCLVNKKPKRAAFDAGLICYPMGGTIVGQYGDHILLAPPFIISDEQIDEVVGKLENAIATVL